MKGFLKRDLYLSLTSMKVYGAFILGGMALCLLTDVFPSYMVGLYAAIFGLSNLIGLTSYDETNGWQAYAAAVPNGRRDMVNGRYAMAALSAAVVALALLLLVLLGGGEDMSLGLAALYISMGLLNMDLSIPLAYRFGGGKGRVITIALVAALGALMGGVGAIGGVANSGRGTGTFDFLLMAGIPALAVGVVGFFLSWKVSHRIMAKKEL